MDRKLTRQQSEELTEQRRQLTARLTPEELVRLQEQREAQVSKLTADQLAELHQHRLNMLPADFRGSGAG